MDRAAGPFDGEGVDFLVSAEAEVGAGIVLREVAGLWRVFDGLVKIAGSGFDARAVAIAIAAGAN